MSKFKNLFLFFSLFLFAGLSLNTYAGIVCGDGILSEDQANFPEDCDTGEAATNLCNNNTDPAGGDGPCMFTICGDGITQSPNGVGFNEDCDDSGASATCSDICETITTTTTTAAATTTTAAATTTTAAATTTTGAATTTTAAATTTTTTVVIPTTTTTAAATTTTAAATTTTTTMGGGPTTTTTATPTTTSTTASSSTTGETTTTTLPPSSGESVTVPTEDGQDTVTITTEAGEIITDVSTSEVTNVPRGTEYPFGAISYTTTSPKGGTVTMRFKFSSDLPKDLAIDKIDEKGNKIRLPKSLWTKINARTVDVDVTDGDSLTDLDGKKNSKIKDPIAIASDPDTFDFGGGGCTISNTQPTSVDPIWLFLLVAPGLGLLRRRRVATDSTRKTSS